MCVIEHLVDEPVWTSRLCRNRLHRADVGNLAGTNGAYLRSEERYDSDSFPNVTRAKRALLCFDHWFEHGLKLS